MFVHVDSAGIELTVVYNKKCSHVQGNFKASKLYRIVLCGDAAIGISDEFSFVVFPSTSGAYAAGWCEAAFATSTCFVFFTLFVSPHHPLRGC